MSADCSMSAMKIEVCKIKRLNETYKLFLQVFWGKVSIRLKV